MNIAKEIKERIEKKKVSTKKEEDEKSKKLEKHF